MSDEQLDRLLADEDLRDACKDLFVAGLMKTREQEQMPDVEARLQQLHQDMAKDKTTPLRAGLVRRFVAVLAAAAAVLAAVFMLHPKDEETPTAPTSLVFQSEAEEQDVVVKTTSGKTVPVVVRKKKEQADAVIAIGDTEMLVDEKLAMSVPYGKPLQVVLPDSSLVYLHPGSHIAFPKTFVGKNREVDFSGEAYFCIVHDTDHPFILHTRQGDIVDYGTEFNVSTRAEQGSEVVLIEGSVGVIPLGGVEQRLQPGQMMTITPSHQYTISEVDTEQFVSWRDGYFHFEEMTLGDILTELGRYYNLSVVCDNSQLLQYRMRFIIPRSSEPSYAVEMLNRMGKAHITLEKQAIKVY